MFPFKVSSFLGPRKCGKEVSKTTTAARGHLVSKHPSIAKKVRDLESGDQAASPRSPSKKKSKSEPVPGQMTVKEALQKAEKYSAGSKR